MAWVAKALGLEPREMRPAFLAVAFGFLLFGGYSVMKPLRDAANALVKDRLGTTGVATLTTATLLAMAVSTLVVGLCVSALGWRRFFVAAQGVWLGGTLTFAALFRAWPLGAGKLAEGGLGRDGLLAAAFIVCVNVFNLLSLSLMWSRLSDLFSPERAKRVYPLIGLGITAGGIVGAGSVARYGKVVDASTWLLVSAGVLAAAAVVGAMLLRVPERADAEGGRASMSVRTAGGTRGLLRGAVEGLRLLARSPYLLGLAIYLVLYATTGTILWFEQVRIVQAAELTSQGRAAMTATIDLYTNVATLVLQGLAAGRIVGLIGVGLALLVTPLTTASGLAALWMWPGVGALIGVQVARRALHYAIDRPAREALYTVVSPDERRRAKGFIDTFVYRFGDQCGAWLEAALGGLSGGAVTGAVAACVCWGGVGLWLGRGFARRSKTGAAAGG